MSSFNKSLSLGKLGETLYFQANEDRVSRLDGFRCDFKLNDSGDGIELKTDYWCMNKTPNYFFERYSDKAKQSPGGPWQALEHGSRFFVYFYVQNLTYFEFETEPLVKALDSIITTLEPYDVRNDSWVSMGYRVPRACIEGLGARYDVTAARRPHKP